MDLKTACEIRGLTQEDLATLTGLGQSHIVAIEAGHIVPRAHTRNKLEGILGGQVDWVSTLAQDKAHIGYALKDLLNFEEPGLDERIRFCKQYLSALEKTTTT